MASSDGSARTTVRQNRGSLRGVARRRRRGIRRLAAVPVGSNLFRSARGAERQAVGLEIVKDLEESSTRRRQVRELLCGTARRQQLQEVPRVRRREVLREGVPGRASKRPQGDVRDAAGDQRGEGEEEIAGAGS